MTLPIPTPAEVAEFRTLYEANFGVVLGEDEAWEAATLTLQLFYLATYGLNHMAKDNDEPQHQLTNDVWDISSTPAKAKKTKAGKSNPSATNSK